MDALAVGDALEDFACPACASERLVAIGEGVGCEACDRTFPTRGGVIDFVVTERLNATSRREHTANAVDLDSAKAIRRRVRKGAGNPMLMAQMRRSLGAVERLMAGYGADRTLISLGSGSGFELPLLLERRPFRRVYSSDLAWTSTALVPTVVRSFDGALGLFAADFDHLPIRRRSEHVGFVFLALHHADDPHETLERLLEHFDTLVLVEPITNRFVEVLARLGLARRMEYSGTRPQWLSVLRLKEIARGHGFVLRVETWWELPRDAVPKRVRRSRHGWRPLVALVEGVSRLTAPARFGSMGAIGFERSPAGGTASARLSR